MRKEIKRESVSWDEKLNIVTEGRDDSAEDQNHYPYEPTPYPVLKRLAESGWIGEDSLLVDYGCGKGRVGLFLAYMTGCKCIGIDFNSDLVTEARENLNGFVPKEKVTFLTENAERYAVPDHADCFYFFNPFSVRILRSVIARITESWYAAPRRMLLMFYYPSDEYVSYLMGEEELVFWDEIDCSDLFPGDPRERILCFSLGCEELPA